MSARSENLQQSAAFAAGVLLGSSVVGHVFAAMADPAAGELKRLLVVCSLLALALGTALAGGGIRRWVRTARRRPLPAERMPESAPQALRLGSAAPLPFP
jgi:hypothetical protein